MSLTINEPTWAHCGRSVADCNAGRCPDAGTGCDCAKNAVAANQRVLPLPDESKLLRFGLPEEYLAG